jgi:pyruvate dehydrogenase E2 component (dihydrolipoamide acetyltransferase)
MSVSVSMPQLGESVTEGTVTRWLKREGDHVSADEPLLEVSTDKVDTEIPSPVSGILRGITVAEDETVAVGAELAVIDEDGAAGGETPAATEAPAPAEPAAYQPTSAGYESPAFAAPAAPSYQQPAYQEPSYADQAYAPPPQQPPYPPYQPPGEPEQAYVPPEPSYAPPEPSYAPPEPGYQGYQPSYQQPSYEQPSYEQPPAAPAEPPAAGLATGAAEAGESPYVTPLVRKLAAEQGIDLSSVTGTGVGGRIRKQDVLDAASQRRGGEAPVPSVGSASFAGAAGAPVPSAPSAPVTQPALSVVQPGPEVTVPAPAGAFPAGAPAGQAPPPRTIPAPSALRGKTERLSRPRQVIAQRMVESLQISAQLTTVVEADVTAIARLRDRAKAGFEVREGVKLSFLPFFALAAVEALKAHPKLNASLDMESGTVTYHDAEHLGIAVDTDRGLMVPVIRNAGDLNIGGLARKIADLAQRTRAGQVSPDDLSGGTFTLTNTGSRGALFDTPIINQPQVGILGTGTVNKRAVVVDDPDLGEVMTVRSIVYLALTYDHRLVDGADAARFLVSVKDRLEEGRFEAELGR